MSFVLHLFKAYHDPALRYPIGSSNCRWAGLRDLLAEPRTSFFTVPESSLTQVASHPMPSTITKLKAFHLPQPPSQRTHTS